MRKALSDKTILALKPKPRRYEVFDALCPGLGLRVSEHGRKTFSVKYYYGTKQRRLRLGHYPIVSLSKAREKAMDALRQVGDGIDPASRRRQPGMFVEAICADFIRQYAKPRNRNWRETERVLNREFVSICQSACKRDPLSARKRDPLSGLRTVDVRRFLALRAA